MLEKDENLGISIQMGLSNIVNMVMIKSAVTDLRHELVPAEERGQRESDGERPDECEQNVNLKKIPRFLLTVCGIKHPDWITQVTCVRDYF